MDTEVKKIMKKHYDNPAVAKHYAKKRFSGWRLRTHKKEEKMVEHFFKIVGKNESILDLPCGTGRFQKQLWEHTSSLTEMDFSSAMLKEAKENMVHNFPQECHHKINFFEGSVFDIPFSENEFDLVFSMRLYHHFSEEEQRLKILHELKRVSRKWIIISFYNKHSYLHARRVFKEKYKSRPSYRFSISIEQFKKEVKQTGLELHTFSSRARYFSEQTLALLSVPVSSEKSD